jgi:hypothetical protein
MNHIERAWIRTSSPLLLDGVSVYASALSPLTSTRYAVSVRPDGSSDVIVRFHVKAP